MPYRLFPYERRLGLRELEQLGLTVVEDGDSGIVVAGDPADLISRSAYFRAAEQADGLISETDQYSVESAHQDRRGTRRMRQATRYGLHGVHEYKGKFNPQVVRALCNVIDPDAKMLIDPFCGSGTAPLEGLRLGLDVLGVDRSPMATFLAATKLEAAAVPGKAALAAHVLTLSDTVAAAIDRGQAHCIDADLSRILSADTVEYLRNWFTPPAFAGLSCALASLSATPKSAARNLCSIALSSIIRSVSLQLPEDLRIRRRPQPFEAPPLAPLFSAAITEICDGLAEMSGWRGMANACAIVRGSADDPNVFRKVLGNSRRLILTSPPYATALPYIDTDRLSMLALGLLDARQILPLERELLGSREWVRAEQARWDERRANNADAMPAPVAHLLAEIHDRNAEGGAGFRRLAVPSLLYRYFVGMADSMAAWLGVLRPGESAVLIVGHNRTSADGEQVDIPTPKLLGDVAISRGFEVRELIHLEAWPRYGMHSANGVPGEDALVITRPES
jgi:Putative RNA methylase family UPF0020